MDSKSLTKMAKALSAPNWQRLIQELARGH